MNTFWNGSIQFGNHGHRPNREFRSRKRRQLLTKLKLLSSMDIVMESYKLQAFENRTHEIEIDQLTIKFLKIKASSTYVYIHSRERFMKSSTISI